MCTRIASAGVTALLLVASAIPAAVTAGAEFDGHRVGSHGRGHAARPLRLTGKPTATLIMLPGGKRHGRFRPRRHRPADGEQLPLAHAGVMAGAGFRGGRALSPNGMSLLGYRHTPAYAAAIGQAVDFVRSRANVPVWLIGTSQGTTAAVGAAARLGDKVAGIVLMSPVTGRSSAGETPVRQRAGAGRGPGADRYEQRRYVPGEPARRSGRDRRRAHSGAAHAHPLPGERADPGASVRRAVPAWVFRDRTGRGRGSSTMGRISRRPRRSMIPVPAARRRSGRSLLQHHAKV